MLSDFSWSFFENFSVEIFRDLKEKVHRIDEISHQYQEARALTISYSLLIVYCWKSHWYQVSKNNSQNPFVTLSSHCSLPHNKCVALLPSSQRVDTFTGMKWKFVGAINVEYFAAIQHCFQKRKFRMLQVSVLVQ